MQKGSDAAKALISTDCAKKPNSLATIPVICDTALPGYVLRAAVTAACMGRLRVWVQSGGQGDSSDDTDLNPQGSLGPHHFPGWQHNPTHFTPHCASEPPNSPEPWDHFQGHFYNPEVHLDVDDDTEDHQHSHEQPIEKCYSDGSGGHGQNLQGPRRGRSKKNGSTYKEFCATANEKKATSEKTRF